MAEGEGEFYGYSIVLYIPNAPVRLGITDNNDLAMLGHLNKKIIPGDYYDLILSKFIQQSLPYPFSNCEENSSLFVKGSEFVNYRQVNCEEVCFNRVMSLICKCEWSEGCPFSKWSDGVMIVRKHTILIKL